MSTNLLVQRLRTLADAIERFELPIESYASVDTFDNVSPVSIQEDDFFKIFGGIDSPHVRVVERGGSCVVDVHATHPASGIAFQTIHCMPITRPIQTNESA